MNAIRQRAIIVGCGYVGRRLAAILAASCDVTALVRTAASRDALLASGINAIAYDLDVAQGKGPLDSKLVDDSWLFYLAPPPSRGESDARLEKFLYGLRGRPAFMLYVSTTGVYGNTNGAWVDESTPVNPQTERAQRRMSAEHTTRIWCTENGIRRVVLRVPGIYGPGRLATARLQRGEPFVRLSEAGVTNRIHREDLVAASIAIAEKPALRGVYNITDGNSMSSTEFMRRVAALANLPPPVEISMEEARVTLNADRMSFLDESRRVSNRRLINELGYALQYADVDAGIRASLVEP